MNQMETVIKELYANQGSKLHQMCQSEMAKFGGISQKDYDDFYSRAGYEITLAKEKYHTSYDKTFMEYLSARNRQKRQNIVEKEEIDENGNLIRKKEYVQNISIDTPIEEEEGLTIADVLQSDFNMEERLAETEQKEEYSPKMRKYLSSLSKIQIRVLELIADGYTSGEIKKAMNIDSRLYTDCIAAIKSYRNTKCIASLVRRNGNVG